MACANQKCGYRGWCTVNSTKDIEQRTCDEAQVIARWWADKVSGRRDPDEDEIPFTDDDFIPEGFGSGHDEI